MKTIKYVDYERPGSEQRFVLYNTNVETETFAKSAGLGDSELICGLLSYLEIGNRVWVDANRDGLQDPCEKALAGVNVRLYLGTPAAFTLLATTTTDADGEYYFSNKMNLKLGSWTGVGSSTVLQPNTNYTLEFGTGQFNTTTDVLTIGGIDFFITRINSAVASATDQNDSDIRQGTTVFGNLPYIPLITATTSNVNHTFDAGFYCLPISAASVKVNKATCYGGASEDDASIVLTGISNADNVFLISSGSIPPYTATTGKKVSGSAVLLPYTAWACTVSANAGADKSGCVNSSLQLIGTVSGRVPATTGYTYKWSPITGLSSLTTLTTTVIPKSSGVVNYTLTVIDSEGCLDTDVVSVTANTVPTVSAGGDVSLCAGTSTPLSASFNASGCYKDATVTLVANCANTGQPIFTINKVVNLTKAKVGDVLSYTVILTNTGTVSGSVVATDLLNSKLAYVPNSAVVNAGNYATNPGGGIWTVLTLPASATATLVFSASVLMDGMVYNTASIDSKTITVCTSIPIKVCAGSDYRFVLRVDAGQDLYQWYKDNVLVQDNGPGVTGAASYTGTTPEAYTVTSAGEYRLVVNEGMSGTCSNGSCCPFIFEEVSLSANMTLTTVAPTCVGGTLSSNGKVYLSGYGSATATAGFTYQYSVGGTSFDPANAQPVQAASIPANGMLLGDAVGGSRYFVRVIWAKVE